MEKRQLETQLSELKRNMDATEVKVTKLTMVCIMFQ